MSGSNIFIDTNIGLYLLQGDTALADLLKEKNFFLSMISEIELLGYRNITPEQEAALKFFLKECKIFEVDSKIKDITVRLRRSYSIKLPDAIIAATAIFLGIPLLSADKHFEKINELTFIRYFPTDNELK
jgi:predicted nucleic acid-binding protein